MSPPHERETRLTHMHTPRPLRSSLFLLATLAVLVPSCVLSTANEPDDLAPTVAALQTEVAIQATQIRSQMEIISYLSTVMPRSTAPPPGIPTPTPPVQGAVLIEDGRCCVGGVAGQTIPIRVAFQASSPVAPVTEMRVRVGGRWFGEDEFLETDWEPFQASKTYDFTPPINWAGFYVSVQFRDTTGWVSPVYTDDISVEGMPAPPSLAPTP